MQRAVDAAHAAGEVGDAGFVVVVQAVAGEGVALAREFGGLAGLQALFVHKNVQVFALELQARLLAPVGVFARFE